MFETVVTNAAKTFDAVACFLTIWCGLMTITVERYLYRRRGYKLEARLTAVLGWLYVAGGAALYLLLALLESWI